MNEDTLGKTMKCLARLESHTAKLYRELAARTDDPTISSIYLFISLDSWKHSRIFGELSRHVGRVSLSTCRKLLGEIYADSCRLTKQLLKNISTHDHLGLEDIVSITRKLLVYEKVIGEEYLTWISLRALLHRKLPPKVEMMLKLIGEDEERHVKLLESILEK